MNLVFSFFLLSHNYFPSFVETVLNKTDMIPDIFVGRENFGVIRKPNTE